MRTATLVIGGLDAVVWLAVALALFLSGSDPATKGLDEMAGLLVTGLFLLTGLPALILGWRRATPRLALALAVAFPAAFAVLFAGAVIAFAL
jgi:hypothetical protein